MFVKKIFSLNMIAFLKMRGFKYELAHEGKLVFALFENSKEVNAAIDEYKAFEELQTFLHTYNVVRDECKAFKIF